MTGLKSVPTKGTGKKSSDPEDKIQMMFQGGGHDGFSVALTPDGKTLAIASGNVIQLWQTATGKELRTIRGSASGLTGLLFSPDGRTLAGRAPSGTIFLWAAETGKQRSTKLKQPLPPASDNLAVVIGGGGPPDAPPSMAFHAGWQGPGRREATRLPGSENPFTLVKFWDFAFGER